MAGAVAGIVYNLTMAFTVRTPIAAIWSAGSIMIAVLTWVFWQKGWIDPRHPSIILAAGLLSGAASAILRIVMTAAFSLPPRIPVP
jgi:hypothetical protein